MDKYMFESPGSEVKQHGSDVHVILHQTSGKTTWIRCTVVRETYTSWQLGIPPETPRTIVAPLSRGELM